MASLMPLGINYNYIIEVIHFILKFQIGYMVQINCIYVYKYVVSIKYNVHKKL